MPAKTVVEEAADYRRRIRAVADGFTSRKLVLQTCAGNYEMPLAPGKFVQYGRMNLGLMQHNDARTSVYCYTTGPCELGEHSHAHEELLVMIAGEMIEQTTGDIYRAVDHSLKSRVVYPAHVGHNPTFTTASRCIIDWMPGLPILDYEP